MHQATGRPRRSTKMRYVYEARRFKRLARIISLKECSNSTVLLFVRESRKAGYSESSIASAVRSIQRLTKRKFEFSHRAANQTPIRHIPDSESVKKVFDAGCDYVKQFIAITYATALRLGDLMELSKKHVVCGARIEIVAQKTERTFVCPIPGPLREWFREPMRQLDPRVSDDKLLRIGRKQLYQCLHEAADRAGVEYISPHAIRRFSACRYEAAYPGAGRAILGHYSPGATGRYIPDEMLIERAQESLEIPWLNQGEASEKQLVVLWRRLQKADRDAILRMVSRMC